MRALLILLLAATVARADDGKFANFDRAITAWMEQFGVKGARLAIAKAGTVIYSRAYGLNEGDGRYSLWSESKTITAAAIHKLASEGKLRLDASVGEVLFAAISPRPKPLDPRIDALTIKQLLTHSSGLATNDDDDPLFKTVADLLRQGHTRGGMTPERLLPSVLDHPLRFAPGTAFSYSNLNYLLLTMIVTKVSGMPYREYVQTSFFAPMGIASATLDPAWAFLDGVLGWRMTPADYLKFLRCYEPGALCPLPGANAILRAQPALYVNQRRRTYYALGMNVRDTGAGEWVWWHAGRLKWTWNGAVERDSGTLVVRSDLGVTWLISFEPQGERRAEALAEIDRELWQVARSIKAW